MSTPSKQSTVLGQEIADTLLDRIVEEQAKQKAAVASRYQPVMSTQEMIEREKAIQYLVDNIMIDGVDYGWIPGTKPLKAAAAGEYQTKPTLFKAGAERVCAFFGYSPEYRLDEVIEEWSSTQYGEMLFYYRYCCTLKKDAAAVGQGIGSASTWESKYRYRKSERKCPVCKESGTIIHGKEEFGGGWVCYKQKGGCGQKFADGDANIEDQKVGRVPNPDVSDVVNTVQKMALKRSYVAAALSATGLSARFTQDLEDLPAPEPMAAAPAPEPAATPTPPAPTARKTTAPKAADQIPAELTAIWGRMEKNGNIGQELGNLVEALVERMGEEPATTEFNRLLVSGFKVTDWNTLNLDQAKKFARDLWTAVQAAAAKPEVHE